MKRKPKPLKVDPPEYDFIEVGGSSWFEIAVVFTGVLFLIGLGVFLGMML